MKNVKLSIVTAVILATGFAVEASAQANVVIESTLPAVFYADTNYDGTPSSQWKTYSDVKNTTTGAGYWSLKDRVYDTDPIVAFSYYRPVSGVQAGYSLYIKGDGDVCLGYDSLCIERSTNGAKSLVVDTSGDINLANGSVFIDRSDRKMGIGTSTPTEKVDVKSTNDAARFQLTSVTDTGNEAAQFIQRRSRASAPYAVKSGDNIGLFSFRGYTGSGYTGSKAMIIVSATEDWSSSANGNIMSLSTTPNGSSSMVTGLQIRGHGDVYIPNGNLYVKGSKMNVPDYVFKEDYKLMPLDELKAYVQKNNHLPGVVSADEVDKAGVVNLSGLQMTLLEKVEELTLYTLQQEEALAAKDVEMKAMQAQQKIQEAEIAELKAMKLKIAQLESLLTNLVLDTSASDKSKVSINLE